jgi:small neutral amino acid transporter SnatA (MarC family)
LPVTAIGRRGDWRGRFVALFVAIHLGSRLSSGTQAIVTRFMELIVALMGMQFVLAGMKAFFVV